MTDAWISIRQHGRGRYPAYRGGGGRGGCLASDAAGRGLPLPGFRIASRISVQQTILFSTDSLLDIFLQVSPKILSRCTTVDLVHAKKSQSGLKTTAVSTLSLADSKFHTSPHTSASSRSSDAEPSANHC